MSELNQMIHAAGVILERSGDVSLESLQGDFDQRAIARRGGLAISRARQARIDRLVITSRKGEPHRKIL